MVDPKHARCGADGQAVRSSAWSLARRPSRASAQVSELSGGLTNANYLIVADGERYVVRIPGRSTELLAIDRANELHNAKARPRPASRPRCRGPPRMGRDDPGVRRGTTMSGEALRTPVQARRMAGSLRLLHTSPRFRKDFDMFRLTEFYLGVCDDRGVAIPGGFRERLDRVQEIERAFASNPVPSVPCHNDLLAENYIDDGRRLWIVDFEYSGTTIHASSWGTPLRNAASTGASGDALRGLLRQTARGPMARMNLQALMADVGWTLWAAIQATISTIEYDFWGLVARAVGARPRGLRVRRRQPLDLRSQRLTVAGGGSIRIVGSLPRAAPSSGAKRAGLPEPPR